jgi:hypothetical protein
MKRCIPDSFLLDVVRQTNGPDELRLSLDFTRPPDFRELTSSFRIITEGPMVSLRLPSLDVEEDENYRWIDDKGKQWRSYLIKTDKDEVNFLQILNATFFDVFQGQMLLTFRIEVEQEPPPPITAYFYPGDDLLVSAISPTHTSEPEGAKPHIIKFENAVSRRPDFYSIEMVGSDVEKQRTIQGDTFRIGIFAGVFTSLLAGAVFEILRTTLKLIQKNSGSEVERT